MEGRLRGPNITPGYWADDALTQAAFDEEGYYRLGDALAFFDPDDPLKGFTFRDGLPRTSSCPPERGYGSVTLRARLLARLRRSRARCRDRRARSRLRHGAHLSQHLKTCRRSARRTRASDRPPRSSTDAVRASRCGDWLAQLAAENPGDLDVSRTRDPPRSSRRRSTRRKRPRRDRSTSSAVLAQSRRDRRATCTRTTRPGWSSKLRRVQRRDEPGDASIPAARRRSTLHVHLESDAADGTATDAAARKYFGETASAARPRRSPSYYRVAQDGVRRLHRRRAADRASAPVPNDDGRASLPPTIPTSPSRLRASTRIAAPRPSAKRDASCRRGSSVD